MVKRYPLLSFGYDAGDCHRFGKRFQKISQKYIETRRRRCFAFLFCLSPMLRLGVGENKVLEKVSSKVLNTFFKEFSC